MLVRGSLYDRALRLYRFCTCSALFRSRLRASAGVPGSAVARRTSRPRGLIWRAGLPEPAPGPVPRVITYQRKSANRRIVNEASFIRLLREFGEARRARALWRPDSAPSVLEAGTSAGALVIGGCACTAHGAPRVFKGGMS